MHISDEIKILNGIKLGNIQFFLRIGDTCFFSICYNVNKNGFQRYMYFQLIIKNKQLCMIMSKSTYYVTTNEYIFGNFKEYLKQFYPRVNYHFTFSDI